MDFNKIGIAEAIFALEPNADFVCYDNSVVDLLWRSEDITRPTDEVILAKQAEMQAAHDAAQYARDRVAEYPSIGDQLDALFHAGVFPAEMAATIQAVKNKYPKEGS